MTSEYTRLQKLLKEVYFERWHKRNNASAKLNHYLYEVSQLRLGLDICQRKLEDVAEQLKDSALSNYTDYSTRVFPLVKPEEKADNQLAAIISERD